MLLVKYATPIAAITLPRKINDESALQAASPAYEITRLLQVIGIGVGWLQAFASHIGSERSAINICRPLRVAQSAKK